MDTVVTSPFPLPAAFIPRHPAFPMTHLGAVTSNGYKIKRLGVRSSHIVNLIADVELRSVANKSISTQKAQSVFFWVAEVRQGQS